MADKNEIIEVVKLKIKDSVAQKEVAEWIIENMQMEFATSDILERIINAVDLLRNHNPENWQDECFNSLVSFNKK